MAMQKYSLSVTLCAAIALSACTDPASLGTSGENTTSNQSQGALIGAASGAALGAVIGGGTKNAVLGGIVGAAVGAGIGYSLDQQEAELRRDLDGDQVQIVNTGDRLIVTMPQDILFAVDSYTVQAALTDDLGVLANSLQTYPESTVQIVGHTDSDGDAAYNQQLSERRANAVADVLLNNGVPFERVQAIGRGENQPIASNLTPEGKAQNRRVDIVILPNA